MVLSTPEGFVHDMRAVSHIYRDADGGQIVDIATDEDYHRWMFPRQPPQTEASPAHLVWVEKDVDHSVRKSSRLELKPGGAWQATG